MPKTLIGYARCSTDKQDLTAQREALTELGVAADRIYVDHGLTGTNRARPGLNQALAAVRKGDTLVVPKLDRLARSVPDARAIADDLAGRGVTLALGQSRYDPADPMGKMFFNILATFAEFEADLIRLRTREGMKIARAKGRLRGKHPKLSDKQQKELLRMHGTGDYTIGDLGELFSVSRPTVYRTLARTVVVRTTLLVILCFSTAPLFAQVAKESTFSDALLKTRSPLVLSDGNLTGTGAEVLSQAIASSRFVLLGEDHFSREIPQLATAMCNLMHPDAYAVEAGPDATQFVSGLLNRPDRIAKMRDLNMAHPSNMAFLNIKEENDLAAHCVASSHNPNFELWGLDQEFVGSAGTLLDAMAAANPGPRSRHAIALAQVQDRKAEANARISGKVEQLFLLASTDLELQPLETAVAADGNDVAKTLLKELLVSRHIYQMHLQGLPGSNMVRAQLLKQHFMTDYTRFKVHNSNPRIFLKFGGMHTGKGFSFLHQRDLGNFVAEQADLEQVQSLHVFAMGARGVHSYPGAYGTAIVPQPFNLENDPDWNWLAPALKQEIPQQAGSSSNTLTLFDLRQLRFRHLDLPPQWEYVIYSYDLLVLVSEFMASTPIQ